MITYYLIAPPQTEADYDHPDGILHIYHGGKYFFLYPYLLQIQDLTGQMISPQCDAVFTKEMMPIILNKLNEAKEAAEKSPVQFSVHVGKQLSPITKDLYEDVSRSELLEFIYTLMTVFEDAAEKSCGLLLTEE